MSVANTLAYSDSATFTDLKSFIVQAPGTITKGDGSEQLTPFYQLVQISFLRHCKHYLLYSKTSNLNKEVNRTGPSPSISVPRLLTHWLNKLARFKGQTDLAQPIFLRQFNLSNGTACFYIIHEVLSFFQMAATISGLSCCVLLTLIVFQKEQYIFLV